MDWDDFEAIFCQPVHTVARGGIMPDIKEIYEKIRNGNPISDKELDYGIKFFEKLSMDLTYLGPIFLLARSEAFRCLTQLEAFQEARKRN